jgi:SAM-dependent methyltransferase
MQLRSVGWEVCGVEPDPKSAAQAVEADLDVRVGRLEDAYPESHFDAITMNHVIEHLHEPIQTLKSCARLLKPGGRICVLTPNLAGSGHQIFGSDWFALDAPRHLVLFTPGSLRRALKISGFETGSSMQVLPTSPAIHRSTNWMRRSMQLRHGINPMRNEPRLSLRLCLVAMWLAWQANRRSRVEPERAEELIVVARRAA